MEQRDPEQNQREEDEVEGNAKDQNRIDHDDLN
jgi:hypothetical protein